MNYSLRIWIYRQERERWLRPLELIRAHTCKFPNVGRPCLSPRCVCWWGLCRRSPLKQSCYRRCSRHTAASAKLHFPQFRIRKSRHHSFIISFHQECNSKVLKSKSFLWEIRYELQWNVTLVTSNKSLNIYCINAYILRKQGIRFLGLGSLLEEIKHAINKDVMGSTRALQIRMQEK